MRTEKDRILSVDRAEIDFCVPVSVGRIKTVFYLLFSKKTSHVYVVWPTYYFTFTVTS